MWGSGKTSGFVVLHSISTTKQLGCKRVRTREKMRWLRNLHLNSIPNHHGKPAVDMLTTVEVVVSTITDLASCEPEQHRKIRQSRIFPKKRIDRLPI
jgi:hypothetical protein